VHFNKRTFVVSANDVCSVYFSVNVACVCLLWCAYSKHCASAKKVMFYRAFDSLFVFMLDTLLITTDHIFVKILPKIYPYRQQRFC